MNKNIISKCFCFIFICIVMCGAALPVGETQPATLYPIITTYNNKWLNFPIEMIKIEEEIEEEVEEIIKTYASINGLQLLTDGTEINFKKAGVIHQNGIRYTYYSSRVLKHHKIDEWILCDDNIYRTADDYIVVAGPHSYPIGTIVNTPFGEGIVLDHVGDPNNSTTIDIYVNF